LSGSRGTLVIPTNELNNPFANFDVSATIGDATMSMAPGTTAVDVVPGGPETGWSLLPVEATDINSLVASKGPEPTKPTVTGICVSSTVGGPPIATTWQIEVRGLGDITTASVSLSLKSGGTTMKISGVPLVNGVATIPVILNKAGTYTVTDFSVVPA